MKSYDNFAPFYDLTMGDRSDVINLLKAEINLYAPHAKNLLELGCGTGAILAGFPEFECTGIDFSPKMLQIAQQKLPKSHLKLGTITNFELAHTFDVIFCVFDTINHLPNLKSWSELFNNAHKHLSRSGIFIFDMNTTARLNYLVSTPTYMQTLGNLTVDMDISPAGPNTVDWHITVQDAQSDGTIDVHHDTAQERSYPLAAVRKSLNASGFTIIDTFDAEHNPASDNSDRIYFICRRA